MTKHLALIALTALVGCGNGANCPPIAQPFGEGKGNYCGWNGDDDLYGLEILDETSAGNGVTHDPEFRARLKETIEAAAEFWEASPWLVSGWRLRLVDAPENGDAFMDFTGWSTMTIKLHVGLANCIETGNLIHEFGHLPGVYPDGDSDHSRPRWRDFKRKWDLMESHGFFMRQETYTFEDGSQTIYVCRPHLTYGDTRI